MKKIAIVENGFVRDSQIYTGEPNDIDVEPSWEDNFSDFKNPRQYIGIFERKTKKEISEKAAKHEGVHPDIITLIDMDGGVITG